jgi:hypothetical protein
MVVPVSTVTPEDPRYYPTNDDIACGPWRSATAGRTAALGRPASSAENWPDPQPLVGIDSGLGRHI